VKPGDLRCGVCGSEANEPCVDPSGKARGPHAVRVSAAKRNGQPPVPSWLKGKV
jgi:hypothetical protein